MYRQQLDRIEGQLRFIRSVLFLLYREEHHMAITQEQFDADLAALVTSIQDLIAAVDVLATTKPTDLTAEDQSVLDAAAAVKAELDKLNPATEVPIEPAGETGAAV